MFRKLNRNHSESILERFVIYSLMRPHVIYATVKTAVFYLDFIEIYSKNTRVLRNSSESRKNPVCPVPWDKRGCPEKNSGRDNIEKPMSRTFLFIYENESYT